MLELLPPWPLFAAFLLASLVLAVTPGPGVLYIVARTVAQGRRSGLVSVVGVALGNFGNALAAAFGLAALLSVSAAAFAVVKYAGACYLVYLGVRMIWFSPNAEVAAPPPESDRKVFRDGFVVALLNPKTAIFYAAFLPQFVVNGASPMLLASSFVLIAATTDALYVLAAGVATRFIARRGRHLGGATLIGLGLYMALRDTGPDSARL